MKKKRNNSLVFSLGRMRFLSRYEEREVVAQYSVRSHVFGFCLNFESYLFDLVAFDFGSCTWRYLGYSKNSLPKALYQWYYRHIDMLDDLFNQYFLGF